MIWPKQQNAGEKVENVVVRATGDAHSAGHIYVDCLIVPVALRPV